MTEELTPIQSEETYQPRLELTEIRETIEKLRSEIAKVIVGQGKMIEQLIIALMSEGHVLIEGLPGVAKTLTARLLAGTVDANFSRIQFTPDLMPSDVVGTMVYENENSSFRFKRGPIFSNIILIDEINRAPAKTQAALFECMEERQVTVDGTTHALDYPFMVIATQNPVDHEGTYRLPEAQLDRFFFKILVDYPDLDEEQNILKRHHERRLNEVIKEVRKVLSPADLQKYRSIIVQVKVKDDVLKYIAQIVHETRHNKNLYISASPRASIAILNASKALAVISGRDFVTPEDVQTVASPVLNHRISLTPEKEMEGRTSDDILQQILQKIEVPR